MGFSAITQPNIYQHGYAAVPLRLTDTEVDNVDNYKYIVNIIWDRKGASGNSQVTFGYDVYTKVQFSSSHNYVIGDTLFIDDNDGFYRGYYNIISVPSTTSIIIDLTQTQSIVAPLYVSRVIKYNFTPDPNGEARMDLSNVLKDFVTHNFENVDECFTGNNTRFTYSLYCGNQNTPVFLFDDNVFVNGFAGFVNTGMTSVSEVDFSIGDQILIQQNPYFWNYTGLVSELVSGVYKIKLTGSVAHGFTAGDVVYLQNITSAPSYNGYTTVLSVPTSTSMVLSKDYTSTIPTQSGTIWGTPIPQYNTTATITNINYSAGTGVIITTNIGWAGDSPAISGTITPINDLTIYDYKILTISGKSVFNSYVPIYDYSLTDMDQYVLSGNTSKLSTILDPSQSYRIEKSARSWLLVHNSTSLFTRGLKFNWYDRDNNLLGSSYISNASGNSNDYYAPIGLDQLLNSTNRTDTVALSTIYDDITSYEVFATTSLGGTARSQTYKYEINTDCSMYDLFQLIWKDAHGSWNVYPFKYMSTDTTDVDRRSYYKTAGNWNNDTFGYNTYDRGDKTFFVRSRDKTLLNTGWIYDYENVLIKDLLQSAEVYVQTPDNGIYGCTIDNSSLQFGKAINEQIYQYNLTIVYANNEIRL
jgi:hypothetical protein